MRSLTHTRVYRMTTVSSHLTPEARIWGGWVARESLFAQVQGEGRSRTGMFMPLTH